MPPLSVCRGGNFNFSIFQFSLRLVEFRLTLLAAGAAPVVGQVVEGYAIVLGRIIDVAADTADILARSLLLGEVYAAGEQPIVAADGRTLARTIRLAGKVNPVFVEDINEMPKVLLNIVKDDDVVMTMGAGSITSVAGILKEQALDQ